MKFDHHRRCDVFGPHNIDLVSVLFGALLGDAYGEKRQGKSRICFQQESNNRAYLNWIHQFLASRGYCSSRKPKIATKIGPHGRLRYLSRIRTFSFGSFNPIVEWFYVCKRKHVPKKEILMRHLTPLALAIWISDDGTSSGPGLKLCTNAFPLEEVQTLSEVFQERYQILAKPNRNGFFKHTGQVQYCLYIHKGSMKKLRCIVQPWMVKSMIYKLQ